MKKIILILTLFCTSWLKGHGEISQLSLPPIPPAQYNTARAYSLHGITQTPNNQQEVEITEIKKDLTSLINDYLNDRYTNTRFLFALLILRDDLYKLGLHEHPLTRTINIYTAIITYSTKLPQASLREIFLNIRNKLEQYEITEEEKITMSKVLKRAHNRTINWHSFQATDVIKYNINEVDQVLDKIFPLEPTPLADPSPMHKDGTQISNDFTFFIEEYLDNEDPITPETFRFMLSHLKELLLNSSTVDINLVYLIHAYIVMLEIHDAGSLHELVPALKQIEKTITVHGKERLKKAMQKNHHRTIEWTKMESFTSIDDVFPPTGKRFFASPDTFAQEIQPLIDNLWRAINLESFNNAFDQLSNWHLDNRDRFHTQTTIVQDITEFTGIRPNLLEYHGRPIPEYKSSIAETLTNLSHYANILQRILILDLDQHTIKQFITKIQNLGNLKIPYPTKLNLANMQAFLYQLQSLLEDVQGQAQIKSIKDLENIRQKLSKWLNDNLQSTRFVKNLKLMLGRKFHEMMTNSRLFRQNTLKTLTEKYTDNDKELLLDIELPKALGLALKKRTLTEMNPQSCPKHSTPGW